jgi:hypothetical protein
VAVGVVLAAGSGTKAKNPPRHRQPSPFRARPSSDKPAQV